MYLKINKKYYCKKYLDFDPLLITKQEIIEGNYYEIVDIFIDHVIINIGQYYEPLIIPNGVIDKIYDFYKGTTGYPWYFYEHFNTENEDRKQKLNQLKYGIFTQ